jgi:ribosome-binding protein aMBF1 (putative translation factor)
VLLALEAFQNKTQKTPPEAIRPEDRDFLDELIDERTARNPEFPALVAAAERQRELIRELAATRRARGLSQTQVAAAMHTFQSALARLESSATDARLSTVERYATALGFQVEYELVPAPDHRAVAQ